MGRPKKRKPLPKARDMAADERNVRRKLSNSIYEWNDRPGWEYEGAPRLVLGQPVDPRVFSITTAAKKRRVAIKWTIDDQAWAVEQGFFVQREIMRERAVIVHASRYLQDVFSYWEPKRTVMEIERRVFRCEPRYDRLYQFIEQQDRYGYTGAWDDAICNHTPTLRWYKVYVGRLADPEPGRVRGTFAERSSKRAKLYKSLMARRRKRELLEAQARAEGARDAKHLKHVTDLIMGRKGKPSLTGL